MNKLEQNQNINYNLNNIKIFGIVGSILFLLSTIPYIGIILIIIGNLFVLMSLYKFSTVVSNKKIVLYYVLGIILYIIGMLILIFGVLSVVIANLYLFLNSLSFNSFLEFLKNTLLSAGFMLLLHWITMFISSYFLDKSFELLSDYTSVKLFKLVGWIYLIGGFLTVIGIGHIILIIGKISQIIGFIIIPEKLGSDNLWIIFKRQCKEKIKKINIKIKSYMDNNKNNKNNNNKK